MGQQYETISFRSSLCGVSLWPMDGWDFVSCFGSQNPVLAGYPAYDADVMPPMMVIEYGDKLSDIKVYNVQDGDETSDLPEKSMLCNSADASFDDDSLQVPSGMVSVCEEIVEDYTAPEDGMAFFDGMDDDSLSVTAMDVFTEDNELLLLTALVFAKDTDISAWVVDEGGVFCYLKAAPATVAATTSGAAQFEATTLAFLASIASARLV